MKNLFRIGVAGIIVVGIMAFTSSRKSFDGALVRVLTLQPASIVMFDVEIEAPDILEYNMGHNDFLEAIGYRESRNTYTAVNTYGYLGRYQFGRRTLKGLGIKVTKEEFLNNPDIQEYAMHKLLVHNREKLSSIIEEYEGKVVHGIEITESGILAAAHLAGPSNVKKFFNKGREFSDGYGTKLSDYLVEFADYNLKLDGY